jgi:hypothetical protein
LAENRACSPEGAAPQNTEKELSKMSNLLNDMLKDILGKIDEMILKNETGHFESDYTKFRKQVKEFKDLINSQQLQATP